MNLNDEQERVCDATANKIVCVAGPGSGKTHVMIERAVRLVERGADVARMAFVTFTNAAADEIRGRLDKRIPGAANRIGYVGTLHGLMLRLLSGTRRLTVLNDEQTTSLLRSCADEVGYKKPIASLAQLLSSYDQGTGLEAIALKRFNRVLEENQLATFDTLLRDGLKHVRTLSSCPFSHLFVDEHQDSSSMDAKIYRALPIDNKFWIGDPRQAIYGFRGGDVREFMLDADESELHVLSTNYRSCSDICRAADRLSARMEVRNWKPTVSVSSNGTVVEACRDHEHHEQQCIIEHLKSDLLAGASVGVLVRTNRLAKELSAAISGAGIAVERNDSVNFPEDWPLALAVMALANDPANEYLAHSALKLRDGLQIADKHRLLASREGRTLVEQAGISFSSPMQALGCFRVSNRSVALCMQALEDSAGDIAAALVRLNKRDGREKRLPGVFVGTIHAAKGREWDVVFLPAFEQEVIPGKWDEDEERRLTFVGLTRARQSVFISWCRTRSDEWKGARLNRTRSKFVAEILKCV